MTERKTVIPGEVIVSGDDYLPGENTEKRGSDIVALRFGLAEEQSKLIKVIPLSGTYYPRRGNSVIGKVEMLTGNGWVVNIGAADNAFLPLMEVPRFVNKNAMDEVFKIGEVGVFKIWNIGGRGVDLSIKSRGYGKVEEGIIFEVNPSKVPRIIGKEGSMINLIKSRTGCNITVGQNGFVWIKGDKVEEEILTRQAIEFISDKSFISGLTEKVEAWFDEKGIKAAPDQVGPEESVPSELDDKENVQEENTTEDIE
jgi:exosome complex component RRP4